MKSFNLDQPPPQADAGSPLSASAARPRRQEETEDGDAARTSAAEMLLQLSRQESTNVLRAPVEHLVLLTLFHLIPSMYLFSFLECADNIVGAGTNPSTVSVLHVPLPGGKNFVPIFGQVPTTSTPEASARRSCAADLLDVFVASPASTIAFPSVGQSLAIAAAFEVDGETYRTCTHRHAQSQTQFIILVEAMFTQYLHAKIDAAHKQAPVSDALKLSMIQVESFVKGLASHRMLANFRQDPATLLLILRPLLNLANNFFVRPEPNAVRQLRTEIINEHLSSQGFSVGYEQGRAVIVAASAPSV